ncbi:hypothetical protein MMC20_006551 [Loxospora ochrophaea]|nr:hypothetical protein [Loxospora ochrophaea]
MATSTNSTPDAPIPTLYDETHKGIWHMEPRTASVTQSVYLIGKFEHHISITDGYFNIYISVGCGNFINQEVYESIPEEHRPELNSLETPPVAFRGPNATVRMTSLGTTFVPILFRNANTGKLFRVKLHAYVVLKLLKGMIISQPVS